MTKQLTKEQAASIREFMLREKNTLDIDARRMGVKLTNRQKDSIVKRLNPLIRQGNDPAKVMVAVKKKIPELITMLTR